MVHEKSYIGGLSLNDRCFTNANRRRSIIARDFHAFNQPFIVNFNCGHFLIFDFRY